MNEHRTIRRWTIVQGEIQDRWPWLPATALSEELQTPDALAVLLSEEMDFSQRRAVMEAHDFWNALEERFRLASES